MAKDPAFLFYDGDAARDVSHMNRLERGAYFDLIQAQRKFGGYTVEQARKILGKDFDEVWPALELILSKSDDNKFFIEWVQSSIENRKEHAEKQRKRIQDYWDRKKEEEKKNEGSNDIPRNNHGITTVIPLVNENEIENEDVINKGVQGGKNQKPVKPQLDPDELLMSKIQYSHEFEMTFLKWLRYKRKRKQAYKDEDSAQIAYNQLVKHADQDPAKALEIVEQSMGNNWSGLFELKTNQTAKQNGNRHREVSCVPGDNRGSSTL